MGLCSSSSMNDGIKVMGTFEEVRQWREEVILYRQSFKRVMERSQSLVTRREDVYCECLEQPWKEGNSSYSCSDLLHSTFKKSSVEINMAFKGGRFNQKKAGTLIEMDYNTSIVLVLKSRKSNSVCCACLMVVHSTNGGEVFEMIWFATRAKKQRQGLGTCLFRRACQATKAAGAKGLLITANDNVALWWMSLSKDVRALQFHPLVIRNGKSTDGLRRTAEKGHEKRLTKVPKYSTSKEPDGVVGQFYKDGVSGKPFRYGPSLTAHIWFISGGSVYASPSNGGGTKHGKGLGNKVKKNGVKNGAKSSKSKYSAHDAVGQTPPRTKLRKRKSFKTAGTTVQASVRFGNGSGRGR